MTVSKGWTILIVVLPSFSCLIHRPWPNLYVISWLYIVLLRLSGCPAVSKDYAILIVVPLVYTFLVTDL